jgi:hypothetical protein
MAGRNEGEAALMEFRAKVSRGETSYTDDECCRLQPFCGAHSHDQGTEYYLVRVGSGGSAEAAAFADGIRVRDSWSLGGLKGFEHVLLRFLVTTAVGERKNGESESSSSEGSSDGLSPFSRSSGSDTEWRDGVVKFSHDSDGGEEVGLLSERGGTYGACGSE